MSRESSGKFRVEESAGKLLARRGEIFARLAVLSRKTWIELLKVDCKGDRGLGNKKVLNV